MCLSVSLLCAQDAVFVLIFLDHQERPGVIWITAGSGLGSRHFWAADGAVLLGQVVVVVVLLDGVVVLVVARWQLLLSGVVVVVVLLGGDQLARDLCLSAQLKTPPGLVVVARWQLSL